MFDNIKLDIDGVLAILTVNRPDKLNAITNATVEEIDQALSQIEQNPDLRVLILTGVASGVIHAWRASRVDPAETLRME